ncbi:MAG TPA: serine hydrolase [Acidimicrobiales bacterium]|nr:serine hydrolase [Acidimicrobiales bacterium]
MEPEAAARELIAAFDNPESPGGVIAVIRDGKIVFDLPFGMASVEHSVPNARHTVFYIASTSKQFVGASIALLEYEGRLDLDDEMHQYVPEMHSFDPPLRIHHLLHHTSGLRDKYALAAVGGLGEDSYVTDAGSLELLKGQRTLNFEPGSRMMYSNSNYFLLAQIVERVSGLGFEEFTRTRLFEPMEMTNSRFRSDSSVVIPHRASGYRKGADGQWRVSEYTMNSLGPGGVVTTVDDLARWSTVFFEKPLDPPDLAERITRTRPFNDGSPNDYALGLMVSEHLGRRSISHAGGVGGFAAEMIHYPDDGLTVACLANTSSVPAANIARQVAALWLGADAPAPAAGNKGQNGPQLPAAGVTAREEFIGTYLSPDEDMFLRIERGEGEALVVAFGAVKAPLTAVAADRLAGPMGTELELTPEGVALRSPNSDKPALYRRVPPAPDSSAADLAGRYRSAELDAVLEISQHQEGLRIAWPRSQPMPLTPVGENLFVATTSVMGMDMTAPLRVLRDASGAPEAVQVSASRALNNRFERLQT